jgi:hypothetical protein
VRDRPLRRATPGSVQCRTLRLALSPLPRVWWRWMKGLARRRPRARSSFPPMRLVPLAGRRPASTTGMRGGRSWSWTLQQHFVLHFNPRFSRLLQMAPQRGEPRWRSRSGFPGPTHRSGFPRPTPVSTVLTRSFSGADTRARSSSGHHAAVAYRRASANPESPAWRGPTASGARQVSNARASGAGSAPPSRATWPLRLPLTATRAAPAVSIGDSSTPGWRPPEAVLRTLLRSIGGAGHPPFRSVVVPSQGAAMPQGAPNPLGASGARGTTTARSTGPMPGPLSGKPGTPALALAGLQAAWSLTYAQPQPASSHSTATQPAETPSHGATASVPQPALEAKQPTPAIDIRRLTDEVYNKLEERLRIEKERRGL